MILTLVTVACDPQQPAGVIETVPVQQFRITPDEAWRRYHACGATLQWVETHRHEYRDEVADEMLAVMTHQRRIYDALTDCYSLGRDIEFRQRRACDLRELIGDGAFYSGTLYPLPLDVSGADK